MLGGETPSREPVLLGAYSHEEAEAEVCGVFHDPALGRDGADPGQIRLPGDSGWKFPAPGPKR